MFKKFTKVLVSLLLAISLSVAMVGESKAVLPVWVRIFCFSPVCFECLIKQVRNAIKGGALLHFVVDEVSVEVACNNNGDQNLTGIGVPHELLLDDLQISQPLEPEDIIKNGIAEIQLCYGEELDAKIEDYLMTNANTICEKNNWYWSQTEGWKIVEYFATVIFEMDGEEKWVLELRIFPDGEGCYDYEVLSEVIVKK